VAGQLCWKAGFFALCFPFCYPCYVSRTVRRGRTVTSRTLEDAVWGQRRLGEGDEEGGGEASSLLDLFRSSSNAMDRTIERQLSRHKSQNATATAEAYEEEASNAEADAEEKNDGVRVLPVSVIVLNSAASRNLRAILAAKLRDEEATPGARRATATSRAESVASLRR